MRRVFAACIVLAALAVPLGAGHATSALADPKTCPPGQYKKDNTCVKFGSGGTFSIALAGTSVKLAGTANRAVRGTPVTLSKVTVSGVRPHGQAFRLFTPRSIPALRLVPKGTLYRLNVATKRWTRINAITGSGIYQAVFG